MKRKIQQFAGFFCLTMAFSMAFYDYYTQKTFRSLPPPPPQISFNLPLPQNTIQPQIEPQEQPEEIIPPIDSSIAQEDPTPKDEILKINKGDTLETLLTSAGIPKEETQKALKALCKVYNPKHLKTGQEITVTCEISNSLKKLLALNFYHDLGKSVHLKRHENGDFQAKKQEVPLQKTLKKVTITIQGSLFASALGKGIPANILNPLIQAFSYDIDFQRDIKKGDKLELVFERFRDPHTGKERTGNVLYAALHPQKKKSLQLYRFMTSGKIAQFYNEKGESIKKALMRTPINGAKINSGFGNRKDPIHGYTRMHKGVDFRAPIGTPVLAAGDGRVKKAARSGGYGNVVQIQHNKEYSTVYAHLNKFASNIRPGVSVKQGSVIGYVGKTGRTTGAHLHFEVLKNGVHINPNSIKSMSSGKLAGKELKLFLELKKKIEQDIKKLEKTMDLAAIEDLIPSKKS